MANKRKFLADFLGQEIYVIEGKPDYSQESQIQVEAPQVQENSLEYSGSNSSKVLVITEKNITEKEVDLLENILKSIGLSREEIALVQDDENLGECIDKLIEIKANRVISFGVSSGKSRLLDIQTKYAPTTVEERTVIMADSLQLINEDKDLKRELWKCLQEVF